MDVVNLNLVLMVSVAYIGRHLLQMRRHPDIYVVPRKGLEPSRVAPLVPETRRARGTRALSLSGAARQWLYAQVNLAELAGAACE